MFPDVSEFFGRLLKTLACGSLLAISAVASNAQALELTQRTAHQAVVLSYHDVKRQGEKLLQEDVDVERLEDQFEYMRLNGYTVLALDELIKHKTQGTALPPNSVVLTFDDGYVSFYTKVFPLLKKYQYPATLALVTRWMEMDGDEVVDYNGFKVQRKDFITWAQANEMMQSGLVEIASHTHDLHHGVVANSQGSLMPAAIAPKLMGNRFESAAEYETRIRFDLKLSMDIIEKRTGVKPASLVWPYGQFNEKSRNIAKDLGFQSALTLRDYADSDEFDPWTTPRKMLVGNPDLPAFRDYLEKSNEYLPSLLKRMSDTEAYVSTDKSETGLSTLIEESLRSGYKGLILQARNSNGQWLFRTKSKDEYVDWLQRASWRLSKGMGVEVAVDVTSILDSTEKEVLLTDLASQTSLWGVYAKQANEAEVYALMSKFPMAYILLEQPVGVMPQSHRVWIVSNGACKQTQCFGQVNRNEELKWLKAASPYIVMNN